MKIIIIDNNNDNKNFPEMTIFAIKIRKFPLQSEKTHISNEIRIISNLPLFHMIPHDSTRCSAVPLTMWTSSVVPISAAKTSRLFLSPAPCHGSLIVDAHLGLSLPLGCGLSLPLFSSRLSFSPVFFCYDSLGFSSNSTVSYIFTMKFNNFSISTHIYNEIPLLYY